MIRCSRCVIPDSRPDTAFVNGVCSACLAYEKRKTIDWDVRKAELVALLDRHDGRCIVPSSGGKDSHYQVKTLLDLGADVTIVTATTCHLTDVGRKNIDNLSRYARTIEVTPNRTVRAKLNRIGLELVADCSWPEHVSIFTTPFKVAAQTGIKLLFYGECPQEAYGGPMGSDEAKQLTRRWRSEYGGFLGLRPSDMIGHYGITAKDMEDYEMPPENVIEKSGVEAHFLGQYMFWDSRRNTKVAADMGMIQKTPCPANWWRGENLDNAQTGVHDYLMFKKYGYGRGAAQISVDIRAGEVSREFALQWVNENDGMYPHFYMGVTLTEILGAIGVTHAGLNQCAEKFSCSPTA